MLKKNLGLLGPVIGDYVDGEKNIWEVDFYHHVKWLILGYIPQQDTIGIGYIVGSFLLILCWGADANEPNYKQTPAD